MGSLRHATRALFVEVEVAVLAEIEHLGPDKLVRADMARQFQDRGVHRATLFAWIKQIISSGKPGQHVARIVKKAVAERAARTSEPAKEIAGEIAAMLPVRVTIDETTRGGGPLKVMDKLDEIVAELEALVKHAKASDGGIRNSKLIVSATRELRGCIGMRLKPYQAMREVGEVDRLHEAIIQEIARESPATAERILRRVDQIAAQWTE